MTEAVLLAPQKEFELHFLFHLEKKIIVDTSVCTGVRNHPLDNSI